MMPVPTTRALTLAILLLLSPCISLAQESSSSPDSEVEPVEQDATTSLVQDIQQLETRLHEIRQQIPDSTGEDRDLLTTQLFDLAKVQRQNLYRLTDELARQKAAGSDVTSLEQETEQFLRRASKRLRSYIDFVAADLEKDAKSRQTLSASDLQVFEHNMAERTAHLTEAYSFLLELKDRMTALDMNVDEEQEFLADHLPERGERLLAVLKLTRDQISQYKQLVKNAPDDNEIQARLFAAQERFDSNRASLLATIHLMKAVGLDQADLKVRTLEVTGQVTPDDLEFSVVVELLRRSVERLKSYFVNNGARLFLRLLMMLGILLLFWVLARVTRRFVAKALDRTKVSTSKLLRDMVISIAGRVVLVIGFVLVLSQLGINLGPVLAGFGIAGVVIGFALQDTLANFAAGAMILAYRPYDVGDFVEAAGISGRVRDMSLVSTRILTFDHQTLIVPNSKIWGDVIRNVTAQPTRRVDMVFGISYEDDLMQAEKILGEIVSAHEKVLSDPEPVVKLHTLNESSVDFIVRPWVKTDDYWEVYWDITKAVKLRFDQEGISIPYPQRDLHMIAKSAPEVQPSSDEA